MNFENMILKNVVGSLYTFLRNLYIFSRNKKNRIFLLEN